jgi:tryptophanyl-tRNA synthetase
MRPTGRLHIGHLSVLENWVSMQDEYECFFLVADLHAMTTSFDETGKIRSNTAEMVLDWLSVGLDPERSVIFVQSDVHQHAELHLLFSMVTPLSWLERVPTYKDQVQHHRERGKDIMTYGFLGYPLLQAADILVYRADTVPVGEDQLPHLELCREVARRFTTVSQKFLHLDVDYLGYIQSDAAVSRSVRQQQPLLMAYPDSRAAACIETIADRLLDPWSAPSEINGMNGFFSKIVKIFS